MKNLIMVRDTNGLVVFGIDKDEIVAFEYVLATAGYRISTKTSGTFTLSKGEFAQIRGYLIPD